MKATLGTAPHPAKEQTASRYPCAVTRVLVITGEDFADRWVEVYAHG